MLLRSLPPQRTSPIPSTFFTFFFYPPPLPSTFSKTKEEGKGGRIWHKKKKNKSPTFFHPPQRTPALILLFLSEKVEEEAYQPPFPPSLSHIFTYGDWGRGEGCYAGGGKGLKNGPLKALVLPSS